MTCELRVSLSGFPSKQGFLALVAPDSNAHVDGSVLEGGLSRVGESTGVAEVGENAYAAGDGEGWHNKDTRSAGRSLNAGGRVLRFLSDSCSCGSSIAICVLTRANLIREDD